MHSSPVPPPHDEYDPKTHAHARAELLANLKTLLGGPQPLTRGRLEHWEQFGNAVREYLNAEDLAEAKRAKGSRR